MQAFNNIQHYTINIQSKLTRLSKKKKQIFNQKETN